MAVYSEDIYNSIEETIIGFPDDDLSRLKLLEKPYFFYLEYLFSRNFRKKLLYGMCILFIF
jgi:hypothetical protein